MLEPCLRSTTAAPTCVTPSRRPATTRTWWPTRSFAAGAASRSWPTSSTTSRRFDERDEVRRHVTVLVLTPSRLIVAHTDEHAPDDLLPAPYTSTTTEAVTLRRSARSWSPGSSPTRAATPARRPRRCQEVVLTIGWGAISRRRPRARRPAATRSARPTTATPAPSPPTTSRSGSARPPRAPDAVARPAGLRRGPVRGAPSGVSRPPVELLARDLRATATARWPTSCPAGARRARRRRGGLAAGPIGLPEARATWCSWSTGWAGSCCATTPTRRRTSLAARRARVRHRGRAVDDRHQRSPRSAPALPPGGHGVVGYTTRIPGTDELLNALQWEQGRATPGVAAAPDGLRTAAGARASRRRW